MANAEKIRAKILENARKEADEIINNANERAEQLQTTAWEEAAQLQKELALQAEDKADRLYRRIISMARLEMRKTSLAVKQKVIDYAFNQAIEQLQQNDVEKYLSLMINMAVAAVETGTESVILNPVDRERLGQDFINQLNHEIIQQRQLPGQLLLAEDTASIGGGFILRQGGVENNYSFEALFRLYREELESRVAEILFSGPVRSE